MDSDEIRFTIASSPHSVAMVSAAVGAVCRTRRIPDAGLIELAIAEALNNIVEHAYEGRDDEMIEVTMRFEPDAVRFSIVDGGVVKTAELARMMSDAAPPDFDVNDRTTLPEGGMGLALIRSVMHEVDVTRGDNRNRLILVRRIDTPA